MLGLGLSLGLAPIQGVRAWPDALASLDADFVNDRYFWNGARRQRSDLVISAGAPIFSASGVYLDTADRLKFPDLSWWNGAQGTIIVDFDKVDGSPNGPTLFSLSGASSVPRFEVYQGSMGIQVFLATTTTPLTGSSPGYCPIYQQFGRTVLAYKDGEICSGVQNGYANTAMSATVYSNTQTAALAGIGHRIRFGDNPYLGYIRRIRFFPSRLSNAQEMAKALVTTKTNIHMLGDSFTTARLLKSVETAINASSPEYRAYSLDGVGSAYLSASASRYAATPQYQNRSLIIMDGGLSDADPIAQIAAIVANCTSGRWLYVEPGYDSTWTPAQVATQRATYAAIKAAYPTNCVDTYDYMRANGGGSTVGSNGGDVWAANNYTDTLHPSATGDTNQAACIATAALARGW